MYDLFIGDWCEIMGKTVFYRHGKKFIPCIVTNYYFKHKKYTLVPVEDLDKKPDDRRVFFTAKVYQAYPGQFEKR